MTTYAKDGIYRIQLTNNSEDTIYETREYSAVRTGAGDSTTTIGIDPRLLIIMDMSGVSIGADDHVVLSYKPVSTTAFIAAGAVVEVPVTVLNTTNGVAKPSFLMATDMALAATPVLVVNTWNRLGFYNVPRQTRLALAHKIAENSRIHILANTVA